MLNPHRNLLAYFPSGNMLVNHAKPNGEAGVVTGAYASDGVFGKRLNFDAVDDTVVYTIPGAWSGSPAVHTVCAWVSTVGTSASGYNYMAHFGSATFATPSVLLGLNQSTGFFSANSGASSSWATTPTPVGILFHLCVSLAKQNDLRVWFNGVPSQMINHGVPDTNGPYSGGSEDRICIGGYSGATGYAWNGTIEDMSIWNVVLSAENIRAIMAGGNPIL